MSEADRSFAPRAKHHTATTRARDHRGRLIPAGGQERALGRRAWLVGVVAATTLFSVPAWAGSYLDRSRILLSTSMEEIDFLRYRLGNQELARMLHSVAQARLESARSMTVPKEVAQAHPHLLLMLENLERAIDAARNKEPERFLVYHRRAKDEEQVFRGILQQLGFPLPKPKR